MERFQREPTVCLTTCSKTGVGRCNPATAGTVPARCMEVTMQRKAFLTFVALLTVSSVAWGQISDRYRYLVNATNEMMAAVGKSARPARASEIPTRRSRHDTLSSQPHFASKFPHYST